MKKSFLLLLSLVLAGCGSKTSSPVNKPTSVSSSSSLTSELEATSSMVSEISSEVVSEVSSEKTLEAKSQLIDFKSAHEDGYEYDTHQSELFGYFEGELFSSLANCYKVYSNSEGYLKLGSSKDNGSIDLVLNMDVQITKIEIVAQTYFNHYSYGTTEGWNIDDSSILVNGSIQKLPFSENEEPSKTTVTYEFSNRFDLLSISSDGRLFIEQIKIDYLI